MRKSKKRGENCGCRFELVQLKNAAVKSITNNCGSLELRSETTFSIKKYKIQQEELCN